MVFLAGLHVLAWVSEMVGIVLIVVDIRNDRRLARELASGAVAGDAPTEVEYGGGAFRLGGMFTEDFLRVKHDAEALERFIAERVGGSLGKRILGVALVVVGATMSFVADFISTVTA